MKRYVLLILTLACLFSPKLCLAELKKEYNKYTGNEDLMSICTDAPSYRSDTEDYEYIDEVRFYKADESNYVILFRSIYDMGDTIQGPYKEWIIINNFPFRLGGRVVSDTGQGGELIGYYLISGEIIAKIKKAKTVKMKYTGAYGMFTSVDIPESILKEWKEIIRNGG